MGTLSLTQYSKVANSMPWHGDLVPTRINMRGTKYDFKKNDQHSQLYYLSQFKRAEPASPITFRTRFTNIIKQLNDWRAYNAIYWLAWHTYLKLGARRRHAGRDISRALLLSRPRWSYIYNTVKGFLPISMAVPWTLPWGFSSRSLNFSWQAATVL